jgi:hypothetical protein
MQKPGILPLPYEKKRRIMRPGLLVTRNENCSGGNSAGLTDEQGERAVLFQE